MINTRAVRSRTVPGLVERSACELLRALAAATAPDRAIVELGAYTGRSTGYLLLGAQDGRGAHVTAVDPWSRRTDTYVGQVRGIGQAEAEFLAHMTRIGAGPDQLTVIRDFAAAAAAGWSGPSVGLLWHDAGHGADEVAADLAAWLPHLADDAVVVLHDAGNPTCGVVEGARRVLDAPGWDWAGRDLQLWARRPQRRGVLVVRRRAAG